MDLKKKVKRIFGRDEKRKQERIENLFLYTRSDFTPQFSPWLCLLFLVFCFKRFCFCHIYIYIHAMFNRPRHPQNCGLLTGKKERERSRISIHFFFFISPWPHIPIYFSSYFTSFMTLVFFNILKKVHSLFIS